MADIPRYESPPTTPPRIDRNDESQDGRDRIQTQIEQLREAATKFKEERATQHATASCGRRATNRGPLPDKPASASK